MHPRQPKNIRSKPKQKNRRKIKLPPNLPAFPGQVVKMMKFEGVPVLLTTTVTTGVIANIYPITVGSIANFATRVGTLFEEYRVVRVKFSVKNFSAANPGLYVHWIDEKQNTAPTLAEAQQKSSKTFSCSSPSPHTLTWKASDPLDLQYIDIGTINTVLATYKIYTDSANFGANPVATAYAQITAELYVQFRGYN